jgi:hypothetical protein
MATHDARTVGNLHDVLQFIAPDGSPMDRPVNTLVEIDHFSKDMPALPANAGLTHHIMRAIQLPTGYLVDVGGSWKDSKAKFERVIEGLCTIRSSYNAPLDTYEQESEEIGRVQLQSQLDAHMATINQSCTNIMIEGPSTPNQSAILGLMERSPYNTYDNLFCYNVGGSGSDLRSAWLMKPGIDTVCTLYNPNHPTLGIEQKEMPINKVTGLGTSEDEHRWDMNVEFRIIKGICIRDMTAVKRLCNIPCGSSDYPGEDVVRAAIRMSIINATKQPGYGQALGTAEPDILNTWMLYCDEQVYAHLVLAGNDKTFVYKSAENIYRTELPMIGDNIIVRRMDALNKTSGSGDTAVAAAA